MLRKYLLLLLLPIALYSCEKPEEALVLPPPTGASHIVIELGSKYENQVFFDFASGKAVLTSDPASWDLSFESGTAQKHIFINGGQKVYIYNTRKTVMDEVTTLPEGVSNSGTGWTHDMPCGMSDSTAIGDWFKADGSTKGDVYVMQLAPPNREQIKLRLLSLDGNTYRFEWAPLGSKGTATQVLLPKDTAANFSYFSFKNGQTFPEPPKNSWDVVFTRYRHIYRNYDGHALFPYEVTGVLLNPGRSRAVADSLSGFDNIDLALAQSKTPSVFRDAIGFTWKDYINAVYVVKRSHCYMLWTRQGQIYKLHFLDYANSGGESGYPSMEYLRMQ